MNKLHEEALSLAHEISEGCNEGDGSLVLLFPPFPFIKELSELCRSRIDLQVGAQNCSANSSGAFTGEVSAAMLASCGAQWVIIGHSERRTLFGETSEMLVKKISEALKAGLKVIWCCGEHLPERNAGNHFEVVKKQMQSELVHCTKEDWKNLVIAYEPVWAIGTGVTASPEQAGEMHAYIRGVLEEMFGKSMATETSILYGGSCNPSNASTLFALPDVDGGLIGGASLQAEQFLSIISSLKA